MLLCGASSDVFDKLNKSLINYACLLCYLYGPIEAQENFSTSKQPNTTAEEITLSVIFTMILLSKNEQ